MATVSDPMATLRTCSYCGGPAEQCEQIRENDNWWMGLHQEREDIVALRERQRRVRVQWGHEGAFGEGVLRTDVFRSAGTTAPDDPVQIMLHQLGKRR